MADALLSTLAAVALVAAGLALLSLVTLVPFVRALDTAQRRRLDLTRWGLVSAGCALGGLAAAAAAARSDRPLWVVAVAAASTWLGPLLARTVPPGLVGGTAGRHS